MSEQEHRGKIRYFRSGSSGLWYFHVQADNNEIISASEGYQNKDDMMDTLKRYYPDWELEESVIGDES
mgnify:CR=1 FL=1